MDFIEENKEINDVLYPFINNLLVNIEHKKLSDIKRDLNPINRVQYLKTSSETKKVLLALNAIIADLNSIQLIISNNVI